VPFTAEERARVRTFLGVSPLAAADRVTLDNQLDAVESIDDGGASEAHARALLAAAIGIEDKIDSELSRLDALQVDELRIDALRAVLVLRSEGRRTVSLIGIVLNMRPRVDVFSSRRE
jgi:hypothetical protein